MNTKSVVVVVIVAILVGVLYVVFEKNFMGGVSFDNLQTTSLKEASEDTVIKKAEESSIIKYPEPQATGAPVDGSTDLLQDAENLKMRDYSGMFEELKDTVSQ